MAKKKKMTKAQAAAARKEPTSQSLAKARSKEKLKEIRATQRKVQIEQSRSPVVIIVVGSLLVLAIFILAWVLTIGPGMIVN